MKATFEALNSGNNSFLVRKFKEKRFAAPYHFHPEYELTLILKGCGKRYVGTHMTDYFPDDLVLLGSNLPHCWKTENEPKAYSVSIVIQFTKDFLGKDFFSKPEMSQILLLLNNSKHGIQFTKDISAIQQKMIDLCDEKNAFKKLYFLLDILYELASANDYVLLDTENKYAELSTTEKERINLVMAYIVENFQQQISLTDAASTINMTTHAFCKYFKKITRKTFIEAVNDYRINFAVRQLVNTDKSVSQVGFESGFNDVSNFYKTFKERIKLSPLNYKKIYNKKII